MINNVTSEPDREGTKAKLQLQQQTRAAMSSPILVETPSVTVERRRACTAIPGSEEKSAVLARRRLPNNQEPTADSGGGSG